MFYKPLENLNQVDTVKFVSIGKEEEGKFGPQHQCEVSVNGKPMQWTLSQAKYGQLAEAGFVSGNTVSITKWKDGVKKGYNFESPVKSNPYEQPQDEEKIFNEVFSPEPQAEPYKEINFAGRGASWNNAFAYCLQHGNVPEDIDTFCEFVAKTAERIAPYQEQFVQGK